MGIFIFQQIKNMLTSYWTGIDRKVNEKIAIAASLRLRPRSPVSYFFILCYMKGYYNLCGKSTTHVKNE